MKGHIMTIKIKLSEITDSVHYESIGASVAEAEGIVVRSFHSPISNLARKLVNAGHDPDEAIVVVRGEAIIFDELPLWRWAVTSTINEAFKKVGQYKLYSDTINALIARAKISGKEDLKAWHERSAGSPDAKA